MAIGIGAAIVAAAGYSATVGIGAIIAGAINGLIIGAVIGGIGAAITGGSIGKGILFGAIGGAVTGGLGAWASSAGSVSSVAGGGVDAVSGASPAISASSQVGNTAYSATGGAYSIGTSTVQTGASGALGGVSGKLFESVPGALITAGGSALEAYSAAGDAEDARAIGVEEAQRNRELQEKLQAMANEASLAAAGSSNETQLRISELNNATAQRGQTLSAKTAADQLAEQKRQAVEATALAQESRERMSGALQGQEVQEGSTYEGPSVFQSIVGNQDKVYGEEEVVV